MKRIIRYIAPLFLLMAVTDIVAQDREPEHYSFEFRGEPLGEALDRLIRTADIDLVYDPRLVEGHHVYRRIRDKNLHSVLNSLLEEFRLDYLTLSSGTIVIVRSVSEGPFFGTYSGTITDRETGEPLPGATVLLADASGGTSTNRSGNFSLNRLLTGTHTVIFSYVGYEPVIKTFEIAPDQKIRDQIRLQPRSLDFSPIVVESHRQRMPDRQALSDPGGSEWQAGAASGDAIRVLSFMPGIQYGVPMTDLHLQGGRKGEHRILLDGVPVYNPYSFGHLFSAFSPYAIGNIELHKAGYGVEQGSQIAGLVELSHDLASDERKHALLQADPLSLNVRGDLGFNSGESSFGIMTALRTNYWDLYRDPSFKQTLKQWDILDPYLVNSIHDLDADATRYVPEQHDSRVGFFDYHLASSYKVDSSTSLSGSFYVADNHLETQLLNAADVSETSSAPYLYSTDRHKWGNLASQLTLNKWMTPRADLSLRAGYSANRFEHRSSTGLTYSRSQFVGAGFIELNSSLSDYFSSIPLPVYIDGNHIRHGFFDSRLSYSLSPRISIRSGARADRISTGVDIAEKTDFAVQNEQSSTLISTFLNTGITFGRYWNITGGSRYTYASTTGSVYAEPRLSVQYDHPGSSLGYWSARLSGGLYRQFVSEFRITSSSPAAVVPSYAIWSHAGDLEVPKAWHLTGSFLLEPSEYTSVKVDTYYKWQPVTHITSYVNLTDDHRLLTEPGTGPGDEISAFAEATEMTALGGSFRFRQALAGRRVNLMAGYDYSYSRVDMSTQFGRTLPAPWNEPHRIHFRTVWHLFSDLALIAKWQGIWGRTWGFREAYYNFLPSGSPNASFPYSFTRPDKDTLPAFHQVDLSVIYRPDTGPADLDIRLELLNLFNRANVLDRYFKPVAGGDSFEIENRTFPGFYPSVSISATF